MITEYHNNNNDQPDSPSRPRSDPGPSLGFGCYYCDECFS